jgi:hypothetical protein
MIEEGARSPSAEALVDLLRVLGVPHKVEAKRPDDSSADLVIRSKNAGGCDITVSVEWKLNRREDGLTTAQFAQRVKLEHWLAKHVHFAVRPILTWKPHRRHALWTPGSAGLSGNGPVRLHL